MKLTHKNIESAIIFEENVHNVLIIQNKHFFSEIVQDLYNQCNGLEGNLFLYNNFEEVSMQRCVIFITDIFNMNFNEKKILNKLYKNLETIYNGSDKINNFNEIIFNTAKLIEAIGDLNDIQLTYKSEFSINDYFKFFEIKVENEELSIFDRIYNYISLISKLNLCEILVFLNLKNYLDDNEILQIYKHTEYMKISLLLIESQQNKHLLNEYNIIIDDDLCEILIK